MISLLRDSRVAILHGDEVSYAVTWADEASPLRHLHWGAPLTDADAVLLAGLDRLDHRRTGTESAPRAHDEEYPAWGGLRREDVALKITMADENRSLDLVFDSIESDREQLTVTLRDSSYPIVVRLDYRLAATGAIERRAAVRNDGAETVTVHEAASGIWAIPVRPRLHLTTLTGRYSAESQHSRGELLRGRHVLESRSGIPGHEGLPWVALDAGACEDSGEVWSVALAWPGSYRITTHRSHDGRTTVAAGVNPFDFAQPLEPGETLELPATIGIYAPDGFTGLTHRWHAYHRAEARPAHPDGQPVLPVLYNSWEATYYDFSVGDQIELAGIAADVGAELFVVDDGWFRPHRDDVSGLGDWVEVPEIFPRGLEELADAVRSLGMAFGLWVEPEMVNPDSELARRHPEWILAWPRRTPTLVRNQRSLDLSRDDVRSWLVETLDGLIGRLGLAYVKWDMNRPLTEAFGPGVGGRVWIDQVRGVRAVVAEVRRRHPEILIEGCASGGGRMDFDSQSLHDWMWISDQSDPFERLAIQDGYSYLHPPETMASWVTDSPAGLASRRTPLGFRFDVAASGVLGLGGNLRRWSAQDLALAQERVARYRSLRSLLHTGRHFRLDSPAPGDTEAVCRVGLDATAAVVFVWHRTVRGSVTRMWLRLRGLDAQRRYVVDGGRDHGRSYSGSFLMGRGLPVDTANLPDYASEMIVLRAED